MATLTSVGDPPGAPRSDESGYGGPVSSSPVSADYIRSKVVEFQQVLQGLDSAYQASEQALYIEGLDPEIAAELSQSMQEYESRRSSLRATAEAINMGAAAWNALGGRMPELSIPQTLGLGPAIPFALIAAAGTAAVLISWGREWIRGNNTILQRAQLLAAQDSPQATATLAASLAQSDAALAVAEGSGLSALAGPLKWVLFAVGGFLAWRVISPMLKGSSTNTRDDPDDE